MPSLNSHGKGCRKPETHIIGDGLLNSVTEDTLVHLGAKAVQTIGKKEERKRNSSREPTKERPPCPLQQRRCEPKRSEGKKNTITPRSLTPRRDA